MYGGDFYFTKHTGGVLRSTRILQYLPCRGGIIAVLCRCRLALHTNYCLGDLLHTKTTSLYSGLPPKCAVLLRSSDEL